ncbi:MAG TPA: hypothetical protein VID70_10165 [Solirubrobacteraceae bacterium]|jgi:hypothetical protein
MSKKGGASSQPLQRLIVVCRADPSGRYGWIPDLRAGDVTITLDRLADTDLAAREPLPFDDLENWQQRSAAEHRITELLQTIRSHPAVVAAGLGRYTLIELVELRLRMEMARLLRGWTLARAVDGEALPICDPAAPAALLMGLRAGLGLDPAVISYTPPPALPGSRSRRALARPLMRLLGSVSRSADVRIAAVATGKLALALGSLSSTQLHAMGVAAMPFPGLDHGNSALLALRRRLPLLPTYGPRRADLCPRVELPDQLGLSEPPALDRALTLLVGRALAGVSRELAQAVAALAGLKRAPSLRALLLPSAAYGASRLLIDWARAHDIRVGAMQHGIYVFREFDGADRRADVVFGWGAATAEQARFWPEPRPEIVPVGVPGTVAPRSPRPSVQVPRRVLIATTATLDMPILPARFCEDFIEVVAPGLALLAAAGVRFALRPHPGEDPQRYVRLLRAAGLDIEIAAGGPFPAAVATADLLVSSASSVAFEAAALRAPVLLWLGDAPGWVRREHLVSPWAETGPGTFESAADFRLLAAGLLEQPAETIALAHTLSRRLARYAEPFDAARFAAGLSALAA